MDHPVGQRYVVRYGAMRNLGEFVGAEDATFLRGTGVVLRTDRGVEFGEVLCEATERTHSYLKDPIQGRLLRLTGDDDCESLRQLEETTRQEFDTCRRFIAERGMPMNLVDVEHLLGGERIVFYFLAENRVDFRELVKTLAKEFHTRIEMRQIGVRDETKLLADYGDCGRPTCCNTHLTALPPVSMRMAKLHKRRPWILRRFRDAAGGSSAVCATNRIIMKRPLANCLKWAPGWSRATERDGFFRRSCWRGASSSKTTNRAGLRLMLRRSSPS